MVDGTLVLMGSAFMIGLLHTAAGPDHYLPFIILGRSKNWSLNKILFWTGISGLGHVASSMLVGGLGIALGATISWLGWFDQIRGAVSAWGLVALGVIYMSYGIYSGIKGNSHGHSHSHGDHTHDNPVKTGTFWALFLVFVTGPCESLIPLLMLPALQYSIFSVVAVMLVFAVTTVITMLAMVSLAYAGVTLFEFGFVKRFMHAFSGFAIATSGMLLAVYTV